MILSPRRLALTLALILGTTSIPGGAAEPIPAYPTPPFLPPAGHPRVYFTAADLPRLRDNALKPQNHAALLVHRAQLLAATDGRLPAPQPGTSDNTDSAVLAVAESLAYEFALHGDEQHGRRALLALRNYLETVVYPPKDYNNTGQTVFTIGIVYDWCHRLLSPQDKAYLQEQFLQTAALMEIGWPPVKQGAMLGHGPEGQLQRDIMAAAVAMYDERPEFYRIAAGRFFAEFIEPKRFMYPAHMHHQGSHYLNYRYQWEILATWLFARMGLPEVFGPEQRYTHYWSMYARRPDGHMLRDGDTHIHNVPLTEYYRNPFRGQFLAANHFSDPWLKTAAMAANPSLEPDAPRRNQSVSAVEILVFNDPDLEPRPLTELPTTKYFPSPKGGMICRTGWQDGVASPAVVAEMKINEWYFANHQHLDAGAFQIYYRGALAIDSGYYQSGSNKTDTPLNEGSSGYGSLYDVNYNKRSVAHNVVTVRDPNEQFATRRWGHFPMANDGGQRFPNLGIEPKTHEEYMAATDSYRIGEVLGHGTFGADPLRPDFSYLKGDLRQAYSRKIEAYERTFVFLDLKDAAHPAALIVLDRVVSADPAFRKAWLLHGLEEPQIDGQRITYRDTRPGYTGKLTCETLLPLAADTVITVLGGPGREGWVDGVNYRVDIRPGGSNEGGGWRVEVSPRAPAAEDVFLHVLQVGDHTPDTPPLPVRRWEARDRVGVQLADRVVWLARGRERTTGPVELRIPEGRGLKILVADLAPGLWRIERPGLAPESVDVTAEAGLASFTGDAGDYRMILDRVVGAGNR
jgi:hypothetical protein